jgi:hypothetical protein
MMEEFLWWGLKCLGFGWRGEIFYGGMEFWSF